MQMNSACDFLIVLVALSRKNDYVVLSGVFKGEGYRLTSVFDCVIRDLTLMGLFVVKRFVGETPQKKVKN